MEGIPQQPPKASIELNESEKFTVEQYVDNLGISLHELKNKKVLDVGAGGGAFVRAAQMEGIDAVAFSLFIDNPQRVAETSTPFIVGTVTQMPFRDSAFDLIISNCAIPHALVSMQDFEAGDRTVAKEHLVKEAMAEILRVLKPGGEIRFAPVPRHESPDRFKRTETIDRLVEFLKNHPDLEVQEEVLRVHNPISYYDRDTGERIDELFSSQSNRIVIKKKLEDSQGPLSDHE